MKHIKLDFEYLNDGGDKALINWMKNHVTLIIFSLTILGGGGYLLSQSWYLRGEISGQHSIQRTDETPSLSKPGPPTPTPTPTPNGGKRSAHRRKSTCSVTDSTTYSTRPKGKAFVVAQVWSGATRRRGCLELTWHKVRLLAEVRR